MSNSDFDSFISFISSERPAAHMHGRDRRGT